MKPELQLQVDEKELLKRAWRLFLWAFLASVSFFFCLTSNVWESSTVQHEHQGYLVMRLGVYFFGFSYIWACFAAIWYFFKAGFLSQAAIDKQRNKVIACACITYIGFVFVVIPLQNWVRHNAFMRTTTVGDGIIQAINTYHSETGEYPDNLDELVPKCLDEIPLTGLLGYPHFYYKTRREYDLEMEAEYELGISCSRGFVNFDKFYYWPTEKYPDYIYGGGVERIGTWAYVHE